MPDYLTHYYRRGTPPFRSLSPLKDEEAVPIMQALYDETVFGARFKDPLGYLQARRQTEQWVRAQFIAKGGRPQADYPVYMVLGSSRWIESHAPELEHTEIRIPLFAFAEEEVSFTYPDSMISHWFERDRPAAYYLPEVHGKVFTRTEILALVALRGIPEEAWETNLPPDLAPYIEAQVWNPLPLRAYAQAADSEARAVGHAV